MLNYVSFISTNIVFPTILSILYSRDVDKYKQYYNLTKAAWYLLYAAVVTWDFLANYAQRYVAGFTVTIAIMEGLPLLLVPLFSPNNKR